MMLWTVIAGSFLLLTFTGVNGNSIKRPNKNESQLNSALPEGSQSRQSPIQIDIAQNEDSQSELGDPTDNLTEDPNKQINTQSSSIPIYFYNVQHQVHRQTAGDTLPWDDVKHLRENLKNAGLISPHVIGGEPAGAGTWPWATALFDLSDKFICGATLISRKWLLTAAHCMDYVIGGGHYAAVGAYNISSSARDALHYTPIISAHIYDGRDRNNGLEWPNDIALLELLDPVIDDVPSIDLPSERGLFSLNSECYLTGWGIADLAPDPLRLSAALQQLNAKVITNVRCQAQWDQSIFRPRIYENNICTGLGKSGSDSACGGDSGSALQCYSEGKWVIAGVVSWGSASCTVYPSVYARVSEYTTWINQVIHNSGHN